VLVFKLKPVGRLPELMEYVIPPPPKGLKVTRCPLTLDAAVLLVMVLVPRLPAAELAPVSCGPTPGLKPPVPIANWLAPTLAKKGIYDSYIL
jgi:hypothetical protein